VFNVLMGRCWPPTIADIAAAEAMCRDLGLGPLIDRMPAGIFEQVGETGWQLSHGERSRVFLARALLQGADVVLLDESLAALDPENLATALRSIETHAPTAIVIAHP
jgi:ATP-binding cassette subfamily B protein